MSQALKTLEKNIGQTLFFRSTRSMELTEPGQQLFDQTFNLSRQLSLALDNVQALGKTPSGKVSITVPHFVMERYLKPLYGQFCRLYPDIQLDIKVSDATLDIVKEGIDFGIRFGDRVEQGMVAKKLTGSLREALFASPAYAEQFGLPQTIEALKHHKQIQYRFISSNRFPPFCAQRQRQSSQCGNANGFESSMTPV